MTDTTINGLAIENTTPTANDLVGLWNVAAGRYEKIKRSNLVGGTITGGGTLALGGYTLTAPGTGTVALIGSGTWTPALKFATNAIGMTYATQAGKYIKIGNLCFCIGHIVLSAKGSSSGVAQIYGLPFNSVYNSSGPFAVPSVVWNNLAATLVNFAGALYGDHIDCLVYKTAAADWSLGTEDIFTDDSELRFSFVYEV